MPNQLRTQIILPSALREKIDYHRKRHGETLAEYLRKAVTQRLGNEKKQKRSRLKIADEIIGAVPQPSLKKKDVIAWQRLERMDKG